jgi:CRP-like cAMP-binding protein
MSDSNPIILRRMLALRQFPMFGGVELSELASLAENVVETPLAAGAVIATVGARLPALHFVIDGRIESATASWGPREVCGALEVLAGREPASRAIATMETQTFQLSGSELGEVLEDNFGVLASVLRELATRAIATGIVRSKQAPHLPNAGPLGLVERLILLRQQLPFAKARLQALAMLAHASEELSVPPGAILTRAGDPASRAIVIIEGSLQARRPDGTSSTHGIGDAIGLIETLAGAHHAATVEAVTPVRALASSGAALFDVLEDHTDVAIAMLATFASALLDAPTKNAPDDVVVQGN